MLLDICGDHHRVDLFECQHAMLVAPGEELRDSVSVCRSRVPVPVTLYREQWDKLLGMVDEIRNFISENGITSGDDGITDGVRSEGGRRDEAGHE